MRKIMVIVLVVFVLYFLILAFVSYLNLNQVLTSRVESFNDSPEKHGLTKEDISFTTSDKVKIAGWVLPAANPKGLVLFLHGFGVAQGGGKSTGAKSGQLKEAEFLVKNGFSVVMFDFRLQGESDGAKITFGKDEMKDIAAAENFINSRSDLKNLPRGLMGVSFGAAMALLYAPSDNKIKAVIETSAYANLGDQLASEIKASKFALVPFITPVSKLVFSFLLGSSLEKLSPENSVGKIQVPLLIVHGGKDERIPVQNAQTLYQKAKDPKTLLIEPSAGHGILDQDKPDGPEQKDYEAKVIQFFDDNLK